MVPGGFRTLAGFLPDGNRFVTVEDVVRIRRVADGEVLASGRHKIAGAAQPHVSADGKFLGTFGYTSMYVVDLETFAKPRRISGTGSFGNFVSFAFRPDSRSMAVIHGGPTLVKNYDLATLAQTHIFKWKLGPLGALTFSPDGLLGAAGSADGRIVLWDVD
jgi:WD40 repeat protein